MSKETKHHSQQGVKEVANDTNGLCDSSSLGAKPADTSKSGIIDNLFKFRGRYYDCDELKSQLKTYFKNEKDKLEKEKSKKWIYSDIHIVNGQIIQLNKTAKDILGEEEI